MGILLFFISFFLLSMRHWVQDHSKNIGVDFLFQHRLQKLFNSLDLLFFYCIIIFFISSHMSLTFERFSFGKNIRTILNNVYWMDIPMHSLKLFWYIVSLILDCQDITIQIPELNTMSIFRSIPFDFFIACQ